MCSFIWSLALYSFLSMYNALIMPLSIKGGKEERKHVNNVQNQPAEVHDSVFFRKLEFCIDNEHDYGHDDAQ